VDHRVKNNLLTIASILKLQARTTENETVRATLRSVLDRVEALSTVQRKLFTTADVERFDVADFAHELVVDVVGALRRDDIQITFDLSPVLVPAIKASPLALIINELVGDSLRRGLRDGGGTIHLCIKRLNGHFVIKIVDDMDPCFVDAEEQAFSRTILETCARQVNAAIDRHTSGRQTTVEVKLAVDSVQGAPQT
jgi:two-component sensor histidine kinase